MTEELYKIMPKCNNHVERYPAAMLHMLPNLYNDEKHFIAQH